MSEPLRNAGSDEFKQRVAFLGTLSPEAMLRELLAVIHADGGQQANTVGLAQAVAEAEVLWYYRGGWS